MHSIDIASLEAKISSLDAKSILVLSKLPDTRTNDEIVRWSGAWKFSHELIERSLGNIYSLFELEHIDDPVEKRTAAARLYTAYATAEYPLTAFSRRGTFETRKAAAEHAKKESKPMDHVQAEALEIDVIAPVAAKIKRLTDRQREVVQCMVFGWEADRIAKELTLSPASVRQYYTVIYSALGLRKSLGIRNRRDILAKAFELYKNSPRKVVTESIAERRLVETVRPTPALPDVSNESDEPEKVRADIPTENHSHTEQSVGAERSIPSHAVAIRFDDPSSIHEVKVMKVETVDVANMRTLGFRPEHLIVCPSTVSESADTFLIMVSRDR